MLELVQNTRINSDASEDDLQPGEYRDALNMSLIAHELGKFSKGTTFGNIDTNIIFKNLNPDAICLGTAIDSAGVRSVITFYQRVPIPFTDEYNVVIDYAVSRGYRVPSQEVQVAQNNFIFRMKELGIWVGLDVFFCFYGDGDENFAKINWKNPSDNTQAVNNGMLHATNKGFTGTGASYLDTKFNPALAAKFQLNDASYAIGYSDLTVSFGEDGVIIGLDRTRLAPLHESQQNAAVGAINGITDSPIFVSPEINDADGIIFMSRSGVNAVALRKNTGTSFTQTYPSTARPNGSFYLGGRNLNGAPDSFSTNTYFLFAAGENLNTLDREINLYKSWLFYLNSFVTPLFNEGYAQGILMYLITNPIEGTVYPLVSSSRMLVNETSYLDGYSFVNDLFYFNFRESAPKVINIQRALSSPGFYDDLPETLLTIIKPHPPFSPTASRVVTGVAVNASIQRKPFQFMIIYRFVDDEQSTKSPASEYLNSLDDRDTLITSYNAIDVVMTFPVKDYPLVREVELYVRNSNNIGDWRGVNIFSKVLFDQVGENYQYTYQFTDNVVGNFLSLDVSTKVNEAIPQRSNYLAFIENRIFLIDSLLDYSYINAFQLLITLDPGNLPVRDDRLSANSVHPNTDVLYTTAEFEYDSEYTVGLAFYDRYGRKYPSSQNDKKLITPVFVPVVLPGPDQLPSYLTYPALLKSKITAKYDIRAVGNINNYGKPPLFAYWWGMIRGKNTKWEFQHSVQCLLRFPYSITKWAGTDPNDFPNVNLFLEDGYLYWDPEKLLSLGAPNSNLTTYMVNDYIDIVIPSNFPYSLDNTILVDFMMQICTDVSATKITITNREVIEIFANKIRIRGDRAARWFSSAGTGPGQYFNYPKFTTGVDLLAGQKLRRDETTFLLVIKRRRQNNLENILMYDTPQVYPINNPGTKFATFQPTQSVTIVNREFFPYSNIPIDPSYQTILNYAVSKGYGLPSPANQIEQNELVAGLKLAGIWDELDVFYNFYTDGSENFSKINWKNPADATNVINTGLPFAAYTGFTGNGVNFLNTTFIASAGVKYQLNNAMFAIGYEVIATAAYSDGVFGGGNYAVLNAYQGPTGVAAGINSVASVAVVIPSFVPQPGVMFVSRVVAGLFNVRQNDGALVSGGAIASAARPTLVFYLGAYNNAGVAAGMGTHRYSMFAAGAAIEDKHVQFHQLWVRYQANQKAKNTYQTILNYAISKGYALPSAGQQEKQRNLIRNLIVLGVWTKLDRFYNFINDGSEGFALINWINPSDPTQAVNNGMQFLFNDGFKGLGASYINTTFIPIAATKHTQNNAMFAIGYSNLIQNSAYTDGILDGVTWSVLNPSNGLDSIYMGINSGGNIPFSDASFAPVPGIVFSSRSDNTAMKVRQNKGPSVSGNLNSSGLAAIPFFLGAYNSAGVPTAFSLNTYSMFMAGASISALEPLVFDAFEGYQTDAKIEQGETLIQPIYLDPTSVAFNHSIKISWARNTGNSLRLKIKVSIWQLNSVNQPVLELYSATKDAGGDYYVKDGETIEYFITLNELINGWYGYGVQVLSADESNVQFENPEFDIKDLKGWLQSNEGLPALAWLPGSVVNNFAYVRVSSMLGGWSKTLYQLLDKTIKEALSIILEVEAAQIIGPVVNGAIIQYPGNTQTPLVNNATETLLNLMSNIVPYFIDCSTIPRVVTLNTLSYSPTIVPPVGSEVRAEVWRIDQSTKRPISLIAGSEGAWTPVPGGVPPFTVAFGANNVIDTTGWYGMALSFRGPVFTNFTNSSYQNNGAYWIVTNESPLWVFQPDTQAPPAYQDILFPTVHGADLGYQPMNGGRNLITPVFFSVGSDPTGYDQHRIIIDWGDNINNGWNGNVISVGIWELDQGTLKPLTQAPLMVAGITVYSGGPQEHFISNAQKLAPNKWYGFGLIGGGTNNGPKSSIVNRSFQLTGLQEWTVVPSPYGTQWNAASPGVLFVDVLNGVFDTGYIQQSVTNYLQVVLPDIVFFFPGVSPQIFIELSKNGVPVQTIQVMPTSGNFRTSVAFDAVHFNGELFGIRIYGNTNTVSDSNTIYLYAVYNSFNPYLFSSPKIRKYAVSNANYESWINYNSLDGAVIDTQWLEANHYWKKTVGGVGQCLLYEETNVLKWLQDSFVNSSPVAYSRINMGDAPSTNFTLSINGRANAGSSRQGTFKVWVFNDPLNHTAGVMIYSRTFTNVIVDWSEVNLPVVIPGGYKYVGFGWTSVINSTSNQTTKFELVPAVHYNSWYKDESVFDVVAKERELASSGGIILANYHADNIAVTATTGGLGQHNLTGSLVRANIEIFQGNPVNDYDLVLTDSNGGELGRQSVIGQAINIDQQVSVTVTNVTGQTGLFLRVQNKNVSGTISVRIRQITNINVPVTIQADNTVANAKTWRRDDSNNLLELSTTSLTQVDGTDTVPQPPGDITVVLADASGVEISAPQTFPANSGKITLFFSPTLQQDGNFTYGIKVKNHPANDQISGLILIHSVFNDASNDGSANIIVYDVNPLMPEYEAWKRGVSGVFAKSGYVSNFIAAVDNLVMSAFTPVSINPTSYHLVANVVPAGVEAHSNNYGQPPSSTYIFGIPFPFAASDPDAAGIVYTEKTGQSIGDVNAKILETGEKSQSNVVRWGDPVIAGTNINNSNAFLESNKYVVDFQRGQIKVMLAMHDHTLFCVHEQGMSSLYVQRATMTAVSEAADGGENPLYLTNKVIGNDNKLSSNLGTVNPESCRVVESGSIAYGFDLIRKSFWQKTNNGVRNLTYECNAKELFNRICYYRLKAYLDGEDVKIYAGYNEKQKSYYLTFAPFTYKGQLYSAITIAYNAYIDGFVSRYSFEPISYLATEDVIHTIKAREFNNPDFLGDFSFWNTAPLDGTTDWSQSVPPGKAVSDTTVPGGTRILNPDFAQGAVFWSTYDVGGIGSAWTFVNDGIETTIPAFSTSRSLVNSSGAPGSYSIRVNASLPVSGLTYAIRGFNVSGVAGEVLLPMTPMSGDDVVDVLQENAGRIGLIIENATGSPITVHLNLFTTVRKTFLLYQAIPLGIENVRVRIDIPARQGSIRLLVYSFVDPSFSFQPLADVSLIRNKDAYQLSINAPNPTAAKYVGLSAITDYDSTVLDFFNVNSVPSIWAHDQEGRTNNFFGVQYHSEIDLVLNVKAGQVRIFNSLSIMSETAWSVELIRTSENQLSALSTENFRLKDGVYYAAIMRDVLTPQDSLPDPVNNVPIVHGRKLVGVWIRMVLKNTETLRQIEIRAVYLGSDELSGNLLGKK